MLQDLSESEANALLLLFHDAEIPASKAGSGERWSVSVDPSSMDRALRLVSAERLLERRPRAVSESAGVLASSGELRQARERSIAADLETTLERLPVVLEARVHLALDEQPEHDIRGPRLERASAAALVLRRAGASIDAPSVARLIAGAAGVPEGSVTVVIAEAASVMASDAATELAFAATKRAAGVSRSAAHRWARSRTITWWASALVVSGAIGATLTRIRWARR